MYGTEEYAKAIEELGKAGESMAVAFAHFGEAIGAAFSAGIYAGMNSSNRRSNNWRKLHGLPMRRRIRWR